MTGLQKARTHDQCLRISSNVGFSWDSKSDKGSKYIENYKVLEFTSKGSGEKKMVAKMRTSVRRKLEGINKACDIDISPPPPLPLKGEMGTSHILQHMHFFNSLESREGLRVRGKNARSL